MSKAELGSLSFVRMDQSPLPGLQLVSDGRPAQV